MQTSKIEVYCIFTKSLSEVCKLQFAGASEGDYKL